MCLVTTALSRPLLRKHSLLYIYEKTVLKFDPITFQWSEVGTMKERRSNHAISAVNADDVAEYCVL